MQYQIQYFHEFYLLHRPVLHLYLSEFLKKTSSKHKSVVLDSVFSRFFFTLQASASSPSLANHFGMAASNSFFSISEDDPVNSSPTKTGTELVVYQKRICQITAVTYRNVLISRFFLNRKLFQRGPDRAKCKRLHQQSSASPPIQTAIFGFHDLGGRQPFSNLRIASAIISNARYQ